MTELPPSWPTLPDALAERGWALHPTFLTPELARALRTFGQAQALQPAGTGHGPGHRAQSVRGDAIHWLDLVGGSPVERELGQRLDQVRAHLNATAFLNLVEIEAHLACYPPGAGYAAHVDRFADHPGRTVSMVLYLNEDWAPEEGGALELQVDDGPVWVWPQRGQAVAFRSADVRHAVWPATRARWSVAVWFRQRTGDTASP